MLLDVFRDKAEARNWATVEWEVEKNARSRPRWPLNVRRALLQIAPKARWTGRVLRAASILKSFTLTFSSDGAMTAGLDIEALSGVGDSGALSEDLTDLFVAIGEAAQDQGVGVVFLIDEIQFLRPPSSKRSSSRCTSARAVRCRSRWSAPACRRYRALRAKPSRTASGSFAFRRSGRSMPRAHARDALVLPAADLGVEFEPGRSISSSTTRRATRTSCRSTAASSGTRPPASPVTLETSSRAAAGEAGLDESFFRVRAERTTELELSTSTRWRSWGLSRTARARSRGASSGPWSRRTDPLEADRQGAAVHARPRVRSLHGAAVRQVHAAAPRRAGCTALMEELIAANPTLWHEDIGL